MKKHTALLSILIAMMMIITTAPTCAAPAFAASKPKVKITIGGKNFTAKFENNKTAKAFMKKMPEAFTMSNLNGNEIYKYVDYTLPKNAKKVNKVHKGDIMLYGNDCIVIFYKTFKTGYKYTKIGRITKTSGLKKAVSKKKVKVKFARKDGAGSPGQGADSERADLSGQR